MAALGVDFGTHSTAMAGTKEGGTLDILQSPQGDLLHPSAIWYPPDSSQPIEVGTAALARGNDPNLIIQSKRGLGVTVALLKRKGLMKSFNAKVADDKGDTKVKFILNIDGKEVKKKVEDVITDILNYFKHLIITEYGDQAKIVCSRPQHWSTAQSELFKKIVEGVFGVDNVQDIITEPNAAQYCYSEGRSPGKKHILVLDLGHGTFDISFLKEVNPGVYQGVATGGNTLLGGADMDNDLFSALEKELRAEPTFKEEAFKKQTPKLKGQMKELKHRLSITPVATLEVFGCTDDSFTFTVDQTKKQNICQDFYKRFEDSIDESFLSKAKTLKTKPKEAKEFAEKMKKETDIVYLVGGMMRDPMLSVECFQKKFPNAEIIGKPGVKGSKNPEENVARGAAKWCAAKMRMPTKIGLPPDPTHKNLLSKSLGIEGINPNPKNSDPVFCVIIPRNTPIPTCVDRPGFTTSMKDQRTLLIRVYQGEGEIINEESDIECLGEYVVDLKVPNEIDGQMFSVEMEVDENNILKVSVGDGGDMAEEKVFSKVQ